VQVLVELGQLALALALAELLAPTFREGGKLMMVLR
jgi:hypothetical protein